MADSGPPTSLSGPLPVGLPSLPVYEINTALAGKYVCLVGLVVLFFDCIARWEQERRLVWNAPSTLAKYCYLLNRYLVLLCQLPTFVIISGFNGLDLTSAVCSGIYLTIGGLFALSLMAGNVLIAMDVVGLWHYDKRIMYILIFTTVAAYGAGFATLGVGYSDSKYRDSIKWDPIDHACIPPTPNVWIILSSGMPLIAEASILALAAWNVLDRPRAQGVSFRIALTEDGFLFFLTSTLLRIVLLVATSRKDGLWFAMGIAFVWACASLTLSRRMLSLRQATVITGARTLSVHSAGGTGQPRRDMFESYRRSSGLDFDHTKHAWVGGDEIELGQVEIHRVS